jgi:carbamoyl-phosphate synthase small subunit
MFWRKKYNLVESGYNACLVFPDGFVKYGMGVGKAGTIVGEVCFNTAMTGYQEAITDPSFYNQIITFTFPHIGNVGTNLVDNEAPCLKKEFLKFYNKKSYAKGVILHHNITNPANHRSSLAFNDYLTQNNITGIAGVDTREITKKVRIDGASNIAIYNAKPKEGAKIFDKNFHQELISQIAAFPKMVGLDLAGEVSCNQIYEYGSGEKTIVAFDFGMKLNILECLKSLGFKIVIVPAKTRAEEVLSYKPSGVFLSNGPGDPASTGRYVVPQLKKLMEKNIPIFGICLGHQILAIALGLKTEKMEQGHRGYNHPVYNNEKKIVEITSQNHGFKVIENQGNKDIIITHKSLFDGSVEGLRSKSKKVFSVQYHPESSPGPHDSRYLFQEFKEMIG